MATIATAVLVTAGPARAAVPVVVLDGSGFGHGVGLSQWGAEHMARAGATVEEILGTFYQGASLGEATGPVRVAVHHPAGSTTTLSFPQGGEVRSPLEGEQAPGFPVPVAPNGRVRITFDGSYHVDTLMAGRSAATPTRYRQEPQPACPLTILCSPPATGPPPPGATTTTTTTTAPAAPTPSQGPAAPAAGGTATAGGPVWAVPAAGAVTTVDDRARSYRGVLEATAEGGFHVVNLVGVEDYLRGMAEVPGSWPPAAVGAQVVASRTYALRAMKGGGEMCDDARCQVYVGRSAESPGQDAAVRATARQVVTYGGALAAAVYSADAGGVSANTLEGFGTPADAYPYLANVRYDTDNAFPWKVTVALADVASRLGYRGALTDVRVGRAGPSDRALDVVMDGSAGQVTVSGLDFARALGLRSTRFTATVTSAEGAPAPPPAEAAIQGLPEQATAQAALPRRAAPRLDRDAADTARPTPAALSVSIDPRRRPAGLLAGLLLAGAVGAHVPLLLDPRRRRTTRRTRRRGPTRVPSV
jgi:stage II sporulation protein D